MHMLQLNITNTTGLVDRIKENCCTVSYHIAHQFYKQCSEHALSVSLMCCLMLQTTHEL